MKNNMRILTALLSAVLLLAGYVLIRYILFDLHGMKQWPFTMLILSAIIAVISLIMKARLIPIMTGVAFSISFMIAALFQVDSINAAGMRTNNLWIIWTGVFLFLIIAIIVGELTVRAKNK